MSDLDARIARREEWMCVQTMLNNRCDIQEMIDGEKQGQLKTVMFYNGTSDHTYGVNNNWGTSGADAYGDVVNMANMLADNGREASDLILGTDAWAKLRVDTNIREMLKTDSGIKIGEIAAEIVAKYPGVVYVGTLNFEGHSLNIFVVRESYTDEAGVTQRYFPANKAMVTAPACGHLAYGKVVQIDHGATQFSEYVNKRVPKLVVEQGDDIRKVRVTARPLAMPKNYCPYIVATVC